MIQKIRLHHSLQVDTAAAYTRLLAAIAARLLLLAARAS
jgi:hypothetical protein